MNAFNIGRFLRGTTSNVKSFINVRLKEHELSQGHFEYFIIIHQNEGINQKSLGDMMNTGKAGVTKAVKRLLEEALIYRQVKEDDQRNYGLYTSEKGRKYVDLFYSIASDINETVFDGFTESEKNELFRLLEKLYNNTKKL